MNRAIRFVFVFAVAGCSKSSDEAPPKNEVLKGTLAVEIRSSVEITLTPTAHDEAGAPTAVDVSLAFGEGDLGVLDPNAKLGAKGNVEPVLEASATMYTAVFAAPKRSAGPCGDQPMTLALSLVRRGRNARVGGDRKSVV